MSDRCSTRGTHRNKSNKRLKLKGSECNTMQAGAAHLKEHLLEEFVNLNEKHNFRLINVTSYCIIIALNYFTYKTKTNPSIRNKYKAAAVEQFACVN